MSASFEGVPVKYGKRVSELGEDFISSSQVGSLNVLS